MPDLFAEIRTPSESQLKRLPTWAREWIETLRQRVIRQECAKRQKRFYPRVEAEEPNPVAVWMLPGWARDYIDDLSGMLEIEVEPLKTVARPSVTVVTCKQKTLW